MTTTTSYKRSLLAAGASIMLLLATLLLSPTAASASTSANATIHNKVTVSYQVASGGTPFFSHAFVNVTVATLGATPTVYPQLGITTTAATFVSYSSGFRSNSNGPDTYTLTVPTNVASNATPAGATTVIPVPNTVSLWGGITSAASVAGAIVVPAGSTTGLTAGDIVEIGANRYTVGDLTAVPGVVASTNTTTGVTTPETPAQIPLAPIDGAPAITAGLITAGTQVGEYVKVDLFSFTTGTPTSQTLPGTYLATINATPTATSIANAALPAGTATVTTTIQAVNLTITKAYRKLLSTDGVFGTAVVNPASYDNSGSPKPGEKIEYLLTVINTNATQAASDVIVTDPTPPYTTFVPGSISSGVGTSLTQAAAGSTINGGYSLGTLAAGATAYVVFQVTVN